MLRKKRFWILVIYVALMAMSFFARSSKTPDLPAADKAFVSVSIRNQEPIRFAFKEQHPDQAKGLPVVMLHGSPGSAEAFDGLVKLLPERHILAVDLPGFGDSETKIPDYSIVAHAEYLKEFLKSRKIEKAHFLGFSLGGGVVLHVERIAPELVESITFVASIGVQEYELFGDYHVNHVIHGLQLGFFWALREGTPHFGLFDSVMIEYSRNFYDTDQRPLRKLLEKTENPFLIIHGKTDPLVPVAAAREHKRIVPQSEYVELDDNHFFVFMRPESIAKTLVDFWNSVESGEAVVRRSASETRKAEASKPFEFQIQRVQGPAIICVFLILFVVAWFNEDVAFVLAAVWIVQGRIGLMLPLVAIIPAFVIATLFWWRRSKRGSSGKLREVFAFTQATSAKADYSFPSDKAISKRDFLFEKLGRLSIIAPLLGSYAIAMLVPSFLVAKSNTVGLFLVCLFTIGLFRFIQSRFRASSNSRPDQDS